MPRLSSRAGTKDPSRISARPQHAPFARLTPRIPLHALLPRPTDRLDLVPPHAPVHAPAALRAEARTADPPRERGVVRREGHGCCGAGRGAERVDGVMCRDRVGGGREGDAAGHEVEGLRRVGRVGGHDECFDWHISAAPQRTFAGSSPATPGPHPIPLPKQRFTRLLTSVLLPALGAPRTITRGPSLAARRARRRRRSSARCSERMKGYVLDVEV